MSKYVWFSGISKPLPVDSKNPQLDMVNLAQEINRCLHLIGNTQLLSEDEINQLKPATTDNITIALPVNCYAAIMIAPTTTDELIDQLLQHHQLICRWNPSPFVAIYQLRLIYGIMAHASDERRLTDGDRKEILSKGRFFLSATEVLWLLAQDEGKHQQDTFKESIIILNEVDPIPTDCRYVLMQETGKLHLVEIGVLTEE